MSDTSTLFHILLVFSISAIITVDRYNIPVCFFTRTTEQLTCMAGYSIIHILRHVHAGQHTTEGTAQPSQGSIAESVRLQQLVTLSGSSKGIENTSSLQWMVFIYQLLLRYIYIYIYV